MFIVILKNPALSFYGMCCLNYTSKVTCIVLYKYTSYHLSDFGVDFHFYPEIGNTADLTTCS